ncbi:MAG: aspartate ammonia-lyase [Nitrososphaerota archaeon]|nr:aspartate ammonia-lyase [Nitrososphaerota archaeon]
MSNTKSEFRTEKDFLGEVLVPEEAYYGVQTFRAVENFPISGLRLPREFIRAQGIIKYSAAKANMNVGRLDKKIGEAIVAAAKEVMDGKFDSSFVVDVFQAGAGTSQNMNANEVIANRALEMLGSPRGNYKMVHPNDHVNMAQSTNDTIHVAIHIAALESVVRDLIPALKLLHSSLKKKSEVFEDIVKIGRTHLQDAVPITVGQEFGGYASMIEHGINRVERASESLEELNFGGTAVGTGLNAHPKFSELAISEVSNATKIPFKKANNMFESTQNLDAIVEISSALRVLAVSFTKIANDLRLLSSGPAAGLGEINLPSVQPGSSIMPGKVNPSIAEMFNMVAMQIIGNDTTITMAGQAGQLELNVMMPVAAWNLLNSIKIASTGARVFATRCIDGIEVNKDVCIRYAELSSALSTALSPKIGYEKAAEIAKKSVATKRSIKDLAREMTNLSESDLDELLDLKRMTTNQE